MINEIKEYSNEIKELSSLVNIIQDNTNKMIARFQNNTMKLYSIINSINSINSNCKDKETRSELLSLCLNVVEMINIEYMAPVINIDEVEDILKTSLKLANLYNLEFVEGSKEVIVESKKARQYAK